MPRSPMPRSERGSPIWAARRARLARRLRKVHRRRNREMGQGDPGGQHQGGEGRWSLAPRQLDRKYRTRRAIKRGQLGQNLPPALQKKRDALVDRHHLLAPLRIE